MIWFWNHYLADPSDGANPHASPFRAARSRACRLPWWSRRNTIRCGTRVNTTRTGCVRPACPTQMKRWDGVNHGFFFWPGVVDRAGCSD